MEKIFRIFGKEYGNINQAALLLGSFAFLSQVLALFRDRAIAHFIGPSSALDVYYAAFRVQDTIFIVIGSFLSLSILIQLISEALEEGVEKAKRIKGESRIYDAEDLKTLEYSFRATDIRRKLTRTNGIPVAKPRSAKRKTTKNNN